MIRDRLAFLSVWFREERFRKLWKNASVLLAGNLSASVCDLVTLVLTARLFGPELFGVLVLIQTCVRITDALTNFQSWQAVIKYGADALDGSNKGDLARLLKLSTVLDTASAFLGAIISVGVFTVVGIWQGWGPEIQMLAFAYGLSIAFNIVGTPVAILRLYDKFRTLAVAQFAVALAKMVLVIIAFLADWSFAAVVAVWIGAHIATPLLVTGLSWRLVSARLGLREVAAVSLQGVTQKFRGILRFFVTTNLTESVRLVAKEVDIIVVTTFGGTGAAGIYKIAKQFASIPDRFTIPVRDAVYPEVAKLRAAGELSLMRKYVHRIGLLCGGFGISAVLAALFLGPLAIEMTAGEDYLGAYWPLVVYLISVTIYFFGISYQSVILSVNKPDLILWIYVAGNIVYFSSLVPLTSEFGVVGAAAAHVVYHTVWLISMKLIMDHLINAELRASDAVT